MESDETLLVTKAMTRATIHRPAWLDYVAIKRYDDHGKVIGESRFLGLYTSTAYSAPVSEIPRVRQRVADVMPKFRRGAAKPCSQSLASDFG